MEQRIGAFYCSLLLVPLYKKSPFPMSEKEIFAMKRTKIISSKGLCSLPLP